MELAVERFEPVYLEIEWIRPSEYGKRFLDGWMADLERFKSTINDIVKLAWAETWKWPAIFRQLEQEGVPVAVANGISQYAMAKLIDHLNKTGTAFSQPAASAMALCTAAPASSATGATITEANYTGYSARQAVTWGAASVAAPSVSTNSGTITFGNCTGGSNTLLGFAICDSATLAAGNMLWFGGLTSTTINTTQTPPTVASAAMSVSLATSP